MANLPSAAAAPRPFLKWAGGKGQLLTQYRDYFPDSFQAYYEPFLGGGAVFFHLLPSRAVLTDLNPALVNVYRCVRDQVEELIELLEQYQQRHCKEHYYQIRSNPGASPIERAVRVIYLNKTCFNGLYRENSKGEFNVPLGSYRNPRVCHPDLLRAGAIALRSAELDVRSFEAVLDHATAKDFVYFDPPYHPISSTSRFTAYSRNAFSQHDQVRLRETFAKLADRGVKVMLSNSDCAFVRDLYGDFAIHTIEAARTINCNAQKRGKITEVLVTSY